MTEPARSRLTSLAQINCASSYLEIGVASGSTFNNVDIPYKVAVDPDFLFDTYEYANDNVVFHNMTSDNFFSKFAGMHRKFDLILLDGLHTFEQTFRDFCASLAYSNDQTIWLIDDTVPVDWVSANNSELVRSAVARLTPSTSTKGHLWMGDVFKVIFAIHDFFPQYNYATFSGEGQTAIWLETREYFTPTWNSLEKISRLGYRDFKKHKDSHMFVRDDAEILHLIKKTIS